MSLLTAQYSAEKRTGDVRRERARLLVVGDWGDRGAPGQTRTARALLSVYRSDIPDAFLSLGDNVYVEADDDVSYANAFHESFSQVYTRSMFGSTPWWSVLGNHDYFHPVRKQMAFSCLDNRWNMPSRSFVVDFPQRVRHGPIISVFAVDTNPFIREYRREYEGDGRFFDFEELVGRCPDERAWDHWERATLASLDGALSRSQASWNVVIGHHAIVNASTKHGSHPELSGLDNVLRRNGVCLYMNGHDHSLQHVQRGGVAYVTSGAGSKFRKDVRFCTDGLMFGHEGIGFTGITADRSRLAFQHYCGESGARLYEHCFYHP